MCASPLPPHAPHARPSRRMRNLAHASGSLAHAHTTHESVASVEVEPPHPPRKETPIYRATHKRLVVTEDRPCYVCGVRRSDLLNKARRNDPHINPYHATAQESHHWPVERGLMQAIDVALLTAAYPTVAQFKTLEEWVDSEYNMLVLCSACHRTADHAIHRALWQDVIATKFALRDAQTGQRYEFAATTADAAATEAADEALVEQVVDEAVTPAAAPAPVAAPAPPAAASTSAPAVAHSSPAAGDALSPLPTTPTTPGSAPPARQRRSAGKRAPVRRAAAARTT